VTVLFTFLFFYYFSFFFFFSSDLPLLLGEGAYNNYLVGIVLFIEGLSILGVSTSLISS